MAELKDFYVGTSFNFSITIELNGSNPDITSDTVKIIVKQNVDDSDSNAVIDKNADVTTEGANGVAKFSLTPLDTNVNPGRYYLDIQWQRANGEEYILLKQKINLLERVSDV